MGVSPGVVAEDNDETEGNVASVVVAGGTAKRSILSGRRVLLLNAGGAERRPLSSSGSIGGGVIVWGVASSSYRTKQLKSVSSYNDNYLSYND